MTGKRRAGRRAAGRPVRSATPAVVMTRTPTRREARAERQRQQRRRLGAGGIAGVAALVLAVAAAGGFFAHRATSGGGKKSDPQSTILVTFQAADRSSVVSILAAHQVSPRQGFELLVPSRLLTDVCGYGSEQFGRIFQLPGGTDLARRTLSQILGNVAIDGSLVLNGTELVHLVDGVGGITVDVDTDVIEQSGGTRVVVVPQGKGQHLNGARAAAFASYVGPGEVPTANLSRFQSVFEAIVTALPSKASQVAKVLRSVGVDAVSAANAAPVLTALAVDDAANRLLPTDLPTQTIDSGGGIPSYRLDAAALATLVRTQLAPSLPADAGQHRPTVVIENGVGTPGLVLSACNRLLPNGFDFARSGNAPHFGYATSQIIVSPPNSAAAAELGNRVAALLRLPQSDVLATAQGNNVADVVIILGRDYRP